MQRIANCSLLSLSLIMGFGSSASLAQSYPSKPVRLITAGAGGSSDTVARLLAAELTSSLGQSVLVDNQATQLVGPSAARVPADGYGVMVTGPSLWVGSLLGPVTYDVFRDFVPITKLTTQPMILVVHPSLPARTVQDLIKLAKGKPGELNYTSGGTGAISHVAAELFNSAAGVNLVRVAYKTQAAEVADLISGRVQLTFGNGPTMGPLGSSGKLRPLATTGSTKSVLYPDLPIIADTLPGYVAEQLLGFFGRAGTPEAILRRLNQDAVRAFAKPDVKVKLLKVGLEPVGGTPEQFTSAIKAEMASVGKLIEKGIVTPGQ